MKSTIKNKSIDILIAEDSRTQAAQLSFMLEQNGYQVTVAANGRRALLAAQEKKPALIISDIVMPEMGGYELCKAIKADEGLKDIPVILVTTLSDSQDVIRGLECGADNFVRKPYEEKYLVSRIEYLLMNRELRENQKMQVGVEIKLGDQRYFINPERQQILDMLISTYEQAVHVNNELRLREAELEHSNLVLQGLYRIAEGLNQAMGEQAVAQTALDRALELPGVQAGWICLREGECGFRVVATRNLPPALTVPGALDGDCACRRHLIAGNFKSLGNIARCERLARVRECENWLHYHATVPLWQGERMVGLMNLVGPKEGLFDEAELKVLHGVGNHLAVALERARLHEHLEALVDARTAELNAEIAERQRIQEAQARLVAIIDATPDFVATGDTGGRVMYVNQAGRRMLGYGAQQDLSEMYVGYGLTEWALKLVRQIGIPHAIEHGSWSGETAFMRPDGTELPLSQVIIAHSSENGTVEYLSTIGRDISLFKVQEARIARLNRIYSVLSGINTTIVRVREETELFREACRIAVVDGRFTFAWIGKYDAETLQVTRVAEAGRNEGYLDKIDLTAIEGLEGSCPLTTQALTEVRPAVCNDFATDERLASLRCAALSRGYRSVSAFPLLLGGRPVGVFVLYAPETGAFDEEEMKLLVEMSGDISYALENYRLEHQREQAESKIAEQLSELQRWHDAMLGREMRTIELKHEVNQLLGQAGQPPRYASAEADEIAGQAGTR